MFRQKASKQTEEDGSYVIWDYHVFAVAAIRDEFGEQIIAIDRDSHFSLPHIISLEGEYALLITIRMYDCLIDGALEQITSKLRSCRISFVEISSSTLPWKGQSSSRYRPTPYCQKISTHRSSGI